MQPDTPLSPTSSASGHSPQGPQKMEGELSRLFPQSLGLPRAPQPASSSLPSPLQVGKRLGRVGLGLWALEGKRSSTCLPASPAWLVLPFLHIHQCPQPTWL